MTGGTTAATVAAYAALAVTAVSTVSGVMAQRNAGKAQEQEKDFEAQQADQQANEVQAVSQRKAIEARRQGALGQSKLQADAASSGAGALDPTVMNISDNITTTSELDALNDLYEGNSQARTLKMGGVLDTYEGQQANNAGTIGAFNTALSGGSSFADKYSTDINKGIIGTK